MVRGGNGSGQEMRIAKDRGLWEAGGRPVAACQSVPVTMKEGRRGEGECEGLRAGCVCCQASGGREGQLLYVMGELIQAEKGWRGAEGRRG